MFRDEPAALLESMFTLLLELASRLIVSLKEKKFTFFYTLTARSVNLLDSELFLPNPACRPTRAIQKVPDPAFQKFSDWEPCL